MNAQVQMQQLARIITDLGGLGARRIAAMVVVGLATLAAVGIAAYNLSSPPMETLYSGLSKADVARIGAALPEFGIDYSITPEGTSVQVPYGQAGRARVLLAQQGLPASSSAGYELFDQLGSMGLTSFMQEVTRVRALEGEIARTIQAMEGVHAARVHIVLADPGSFRREPRKPSVSVLLRTASRGNFNGAPAIRHLVASAIPGLEIDKISVLTTDGEVLAAAGEADALGPQRLIGLEREVSEHLEAKVRQTLAPYVGIDDFRVSVAASLNTDHREVRETAFDPESRVERSTHVVRRAESAESMAQNGATTVEENVPAEEPEGAGGDRSKRKDERREEIINYEVGSRVTATLSKGYRIEKLSVAVVVNNAAFVPTQQGGQPAAISVRLEEIEALVGSAVGVNTERGDRVTVTAVDFRESRDLEPVAGVGFLEHLMRNIASIISAVIMLVIVWIIVAFGIRPFAEAIRETAAAVEGGRLATADEAGGGAAIAGGGRADMLPAPGAEKQPSKVRLQALVEQRESEVVDVLRQWLQEGAT